jgi:hypothetical protein
VDDQTQPGAASVRVEGMNLRRSILVVVLLGAVVVLLSLSLVHLDARNHAPERPVTGRPAAATDHTERALGILRRWDERRGAAWAAGDLAGLRRLYLPGSTAGAYDAWCLQQYADRGLVVADMRIQVLSAELKSWAPRRLTLVVTDRLAASEAVDPTGGRHPLPRDLASTTTVTMVRDRGGWLVA